MKGKIALFAFIVAVLLSSTSVQAQTYCVGRTGTFIFSVTNKGTVDDTYDISTSTDWIEVPDNITIPAGKVMDVNIQVTPKYSGQNTFEITVTSLSSMEAKTYKGKIFAEECRGVAVMISPSQQTTCEKVPVSFTVGIINTGFIEETYDLVATLGSLSQNTIILPPGGSGTVQLDVDTTGLEEGVRTIDVVASSHDSAVSFESQAIINVENCYSAELSIVPETYTMCPYSAVDYKVIVKNTGKLADNYTIVFQGNTTEKVELNPDRQKEFTYTVFSDTSGAYVISTKVNSAHGVFLESDAVLNIRPVKECYSVDLSNGNLAFVEVFKAAAVPIVVKNTGEIADTYTVSVVGPEWVYVSPETFGLLPSEEKSIYLYLEPSEGVSGNHSVEVGIDSQYSHDKLDITASVVSDITEAPVVDKNDVTTVVEEPEEPEDGENVTMNASTGVTMNISLTNVTGALIETGERPFWKTIVVVVITVIIIVILIIRFILLVK